MSKPEMMASGCWYPVPDGWMALPNLRMVHSAPSDGYGSPPRARHRDKEYARLYGYLTAGELLATDGSRFMEPLYGPLWLAEIFNQAAEDASIGPLEVLDRVKPWVSPAPNSSTKPSA